MQMDIALETGVTNQALVLRQCRRLDDRDYSCVLSVRSGPFSADIPFYFETHGLGLFVSSLEALNASLKGRARLKPEHEEPYIETEGDGRGHLKVSGKLMQMGPEFQTLHFEFSTDQTCLASFIGGLRELQQEHVT